MKAEFLVENVEEFLSLISKTLPSHSQVPVLSNLLLEATKEGLFIYTTNLEIGLRIKIPAKVETEGAITVPGRQFLEAISTFPKDKVSLSLEKENLTLKVRESKVVFNTISAEEFPTLFEEKGERIHTFEKGQINKLFSLISFAVSLDETRPVLTGVLMSQGEKGIDLVATDGFRLSLRKMKEEEILEKGSSLIIPARVILEVLSLKTENDVTVYIHKKTSQVIFETENVTLVGRLISGDFPNYQRVIPSISKTKIVVDREEFIQKVRLSSVFAKESANVVRIKVEGGKIQILSKSSGVGEGEAVLQGEQEGANNEISFNVKFLNDFLKNTSGKTVSMSLSSPIEPGVFKTDEDDDLLHIIMPVRVQD